MTSVRAAVMTAPGSLEVQRFARPSPKPGAVLVRIGLSGICGTDKHTFRGENLQYAGTPHERQLRYPIICGHENVGVVEEIGGDALAADGQPLRPGDRVVPGANVSCGACWYCRTGKPYYLCERMDDYGNSLGSYRPPHLLGGWSELLYVLPGSRLFRVPDDLPDEVAVLTEPMAVTHGFERARRLSQESSGEIVVVLGVGPLGMCHVIKARLMDCGELVAIDNMASRVAAASRFGATTGICSAGIEPEELAATVRELSGGRGADLVFDCSGVPETFVTALKMVRPGGIVVEVGAFVDMGPVSVNPNSDFCTRDVTVIGVGGETADAYSSSMKLMAEGQRVLPLESFVTHRYPLERAREAVELAQTEQTLKVVLDPAMASAEGGPVGNPVALPGNP